MKISLAIFALAGFAIYTGDIARAQAPGQPSAPSGFKSQGINAVITSTAITARGLVVQLIVQNERTTPIYISPITSAGMGAAALSSKGNTYGIAQGGGAVAGIAPCDMNGGDFNDSIQKCLKSFPVETMTYLEPNQSTVMAVTYDRVTGSDEKSDTISFAYKFLIRNAPAQSDNGIASGKTDTVGPPAVVTISFPLIPLKATE